jgi:hypothetical protein
MARRRSTRTRNTRRKTYRRTDTTRTKAYRQRMAIIQAIVLVGGFFYLLAGVSMLMQPEWFFDNIGNFPPYNRHYMGDLGAFLLPLGFALIFASQKPLENRIIITVGVAGSMIHAINHIYDAVTQSQPFSFWVRDSLPLLIFGILFLWALWEIRPRVLR